MSFDVQRGLFEYEFVDDPEIGAPSEIFVPTLHFPNGYAVEVSDGRFEANPAEQILVYYHDTPRSAHTIRIGRRSPG